MPLAPLQQTSDYAQALTAMGVTVSMAQQVTLNRRLPLLGTVRYIPRGRWPEGQADHTLIVNAADAGADLGLASQGALPITTPQWLAVLNLTGTEADLLARMRGKWRNRLRAAQKGPLVLHHARFDRHKHAWLLEQETRQRRERGYAALPHAVLAHFPSENTLVIHATLNDHPVAAMLFLIHAPGASYHVGWTGTKGRKNHAHTLILWHAMRHLRDLGVTQLDLGLLDSVNTPGLVRFKLGSGAIPVQLGHTWLYLPRLARLIRTIRHCGGFLSGLLRKGSIGGPRTSQETPHGSAQHRHYRPR